MKVWRAVANAGFHIHLSLMARSFPMLPKFKPQRLQLHLEQSENAQIFLNRSATRLPGKYRTPPADIDRLKIHIISYFSDICRAQGATEMGFLCPPGTLLTFGFTVYKITFVLLILHIRRIPWYLFITPYCRVHPTPCAHNMQMCW